MKLAGATTNRRTAVSAKPARRPGGPKGPVTGGLRRARRLPGADPRSRANGATEGFVKVLADKATDKVLGVHIIGAEAGTMIAEAGMAMEFSASAGDIGRG